MRKLSFLIVIAMLLMAIPAFAVDDFYGPEKGSGSDDSRRPTLNVGGRSGSGPEAAAPGFEVGGSTYEEFYSQTIDWNMFLDRLYEILANDKMASAHPEVAMIAKLYKDLGIFDLGTTDVKYAATGDGIYIMSRAAYDTAPETVVGRALAIENQPLESAKLIAPDDYVLYIGVTGLVDRMMLELDALNEANATIKEMGAPSPFDELANEMGMEDFSQILAMLDAMRIEDMVSSTLTGEMGIVLYDLPPLEQLMEGDIEPDDIDAALFVGLKDEDYAKNMVASFGGEMGLKQVEQPHEDFAYYTMQGMDTIGLIIGQGLGIVSPNMPALVEHLHRDNVGLGLEPVQMYMDLNVAKLHEFAMPLIEMGKAEMGGAYLPVEEAAYLLNLPEPEALGHISMISKIDGNEQFFGMEMKKAVVQYFTYYLGVFGCGAAQMEMGGMEMNSMGCGGDCGQDGCSGDCLDCPNKSMCEGCSQ